MSRLDSLRAALRYSSGADKAALRAMILELEGNPTRAAVADPERKSPEAKMAAVDGAGGSSETKARQKVPAAGQNPVLAGEAGGSPAPEIIIRTAAQGPAAAPRRAAGAADSRRAAVDAAPGKGIPEKVRAGGKDCNAPTPSSEGGHISGTAESLAPCIPLRLPCSLPGCDRPRNGTRRYCSRHTSPQQRERAALDEPLESPRQSQPRPRFSLTWDASVVIRPARPARNPRGLMFCDDLTAIGDHGSPFRLPPQGDLRFSATGSSALWAIKA